MDQNIQRLIEQADAGLITPTGRKPYKNSLDLTGKKFGSLAVLRRLPNHSSCSQWLCHCVCGKQVAALGGNLRSGNTTSCGCTRYKRGSESSVWKGHGGLPGRYWSILQHNAKKRGHIVNMTIKQAWELYEQQGGRCALTGWDITLTAPTIVEVTGSLDRIDSLLNYTIDNTQWVHKDVNLSKNVHSQEYFIEMCRAITAGAVRTEEVTDG